MKERKQMTLRRFLGAVAVVALGSSIVLAQDAVVRPAHATPASFTPPVPLSGGGNLVYQNTSSPASVSEIWSNMLQGTFSDRKDIGDDLTLSVVVPDRVLVRYNFTVCSDAAVDANIHSYLALTGVPGGSPSNPYTLIPGTECDFVAVAPADPADFPCYLFECKVPTSPAIILPARPSLVVCGDVQNDDTDGQVYATGGFGLWLLFSGGPAPDIEVGASADRFAWGAATGAGNHDCPKNGLLWGGVFFGGNPAANLVAEIWAQSCGDGIVNGTDQCDGGTCCNPDCTFATAGTACAISGTNPCDAAGICDGASGACPTVAAAGTPCRDAGGVCDLAEVCDGLTNVCPADDKVPAGTACGKAVAGECDLADACDGVSNDCANAVAAAGTACGKPVTGECDVADACDGVTKDCLNAVAAAGTVCGKPVTEPCDVADACDGVSKDCTNGVAAAGTECRAPAGECDAREVCDGTDKACPTDIKVPAGTACGKPVTEPCDVADACDGVTDGCTNGVAAAGTACGKPVAGECDVAEACDGTNKECPANGVKPAGTPCGKQIEGACDSADSCDGQSKECANSVLAAGIVCRVAQGVCDVAEACDGTNKACPTNLFLTGPCRPSTGDCDLAENCSGQGADCPPDVVITACSGNVEDGCCPDGCTYDTDVDCPFVPIPTVSEWGVAILALLLLVAGKLYFSRREETTTA